MKDKEYVLKINLENCVKVTYWEVVSWEWENDKILVKYCKLLT